MKDGLTPLSDYFPQYNSILPLASLPWFHFFGISIFTFSLLMGILSGILLVIPFIGIWAISRNIWISFIVFLSIVGLTTTPIHPDTSLVENSISYYPIMPIRYFFGIIIFLLLSLNRSGSAYLKWSALIVGAIATINNLDFGFPAFFAAMAAISISAAGSIKEKLSSLVRTGASTLAALFLVIFCYGMFCVLRSGSWPHWELIGDFQRAFAISGFYMLPMPRLGLQWALYLTFMTSVICGILGCLSRDTALRHSASICVYSGIYGLGCATYYVGRSHVDVLPAIFLAWVISAGCLLCWTFQLLKSYDNSGIRSRPFLAMTLSPVFLFPLFLGIWALDHLSNPISQLSRICTSSIVVDDYQSSMSSKISYVRRMSPAGSTVAIVDVASHYIAVRAGVLNCFPFAGVGSLILEKQSELAAHAIINSAADQLFITPYQPIQMQV